MITALKMDVSSEGKSAGAMVPAARRLETAAYIADLSVDLALLANRAGLDAVAGALLVAAQTARLNADRPAAVE